MDQKQVSEFLRLLAHDLQNQIGAVDLNLQIMPTLLEDKTGKSLIDEKHPLHSFMARAAVSATEMIETLTDVQKFAYSIGDKQAPVLAPTDISTLARDCVLALGRPLAAREVTIEVGESATGSAAVDRDSVSRAVRLLVAEAARSSFPGSKITLNSTTDDKNQSTLTIHTNQDGLFDEQRPTLALFLAKEALKPSKVELQFFTGTSRSAVRFVFPNGTPTSAST
ncbi:MAG: HAMP domain-containing histidine kinase [Proteobacteria bacterium]|nr:MAG: HAMP domain-containing histidine kinase [Pseudomonadota bacterium]